MKSQTPFVILGYLALVFVVMWWSGRVTEVVAFEGVLVPVNDPTRSMEFYRDVLGFSPIVSDGESPGSKLLGISIADGRKLFLIPSGGSSPRTSIKTPQPPATIVFRMKGGLKALQARLTYQFKNHVIETISTSYADQLPPSSVSAIRDEKWGREFALRDPDGNILIFFQAEHRGGNRL